MRQHRTIWGKYTKTVWDRKSAEQGFADGQFNLGRAYQFGMAVPQSRQEAIRWFDKAGDQGNDQLIDQMQAFKWE
jgi:TPR repeat protein